MEAVVAALIGAVVGALISTGGSAYLIVKQDRDRKAFEVWIRLLNSYQDFAHGLRQMMSPEIARARHLWEAGYTNALKALHDASTLDPQGQERTRRMVAVLETVRQRNPSQPADPDEVAREIHSIFQDFQSDYNVQLPSAD